MDKIMQEEIQTYTAKDFASDQEENGALAAVIILF